MKPWSAITVEISTCHSLISSYILHQPNPWKTRVELSKPCFELIFAKKANFSQQNLWWSSFATIRKKKPPKTCKNSSKPIKTRKNRSPKPTKSLVLPGPPNLVFCRVRMPLQHMPPKLLNSIYIYIYIDFKYINEILVPNDGWDPLFFIGFHCFDLVFHYFSLFFNYMVEHRYIDTVYIDAYIYTAGQEVIMQPW